MNKVNKPHNKPIPIITIDGPSGAGKGTLAVLLGRLLNWPVLDSGMIYRVSALAALEHNINLSDEINIIQLVTQLNIQFKPDPASNEMHVFLANKNISKQVRTEEIGHAASKIALLPNLRLALLQRQRDFARFPGLIADGRDMGTVIFPDATIKFFLTASIQKRAQRRLKQLKNKGINANLVNLLTEIKIRDARDSKRKHAPLQAAKDAFIIDSSELSIEDVLQKITIHLADHHLL